MCTKDPFWSCYRKIEFWAKAEFSKAAIVLLCIYYKLQSFEFMPVYGFTQGVLPIMGMILARIKTPVVACSENRLIIALVIIFAGTGAFLGGSRVFC